MPHKNKSRNAPVRCEPGRAQEAASAAAEEEEDAGPVEESLAAQDRGDGGGGGGEDNVGDGDITKSPSDPKQYR